MQQLDTFASLKRRLHQGEITYGVWVTFRDAALVELIGGVGFDWIIFDLEHSPYTVENLETALLALNGTETVPLVRVPANDQVWIKHVLDAGAGGVILPNVLTADDVHNAVRWGKYPPEGARGFGPRRASSYYRDIDEYVRCANESTILAAQVEHTDAVENVEKIVSIEAVDVVLVGPMDLSGSLGVIGQNKHKSVLRDIERIVQSAASQGKCIGLPMQHEPEELDRWVSLGCRFLFLGEDHSALRKSLVNGLHSLKQRYAMNYKA